MLTDMPIYKNCNARYAYARRFTKRANTLPPKIPKNRACHRAFMKNPARARIFPNGQMLECSMCPLLKRTNTRLHVPDKLWPATSLVYTQNWNGLEFRPKLHFPMMLIHTAVAQCVGLVDIIAQCYSILCAIEIEKIVKNVNLFASIYAIALYFCNIFDIAPHCVVQCPLALHAKTISHLY